MRLPVVLKGSVFVVALAASAALGTAIGSAGGPYDEWGCPPERIGYTLYTYAEGGGYESPEATLDALAFFLARDGSREESEYEDALASSVGPDRYQADTGEIYVDDRIEADIALTQLDDGTWTVDNVTLCGPPVPPELASPYPTPGLDENAG